MFTRDGNTPEMVSFRDYKIDYKRCLGEGTYGAVYELARRPDDERNCWATTFPYIYDYFYPASQDSEPVEDYCVKIFKSSIRVMFEIARSDDRFLLFAYKSLFAPTQEKHANETLREHNLSTITFYNSSSMYAQFKTKVTGQTFLKILWDELLLEPSNFMMRKSLVDFISTAEEEKLFFADMTPSNIMYDEIHSRWEIIDGAVSETNDSFEYEDASSILSIARCFYNRKNHPMYVLLKLLEQAVNANQEYTEETDAKILKKCNMNSVSDAYFHQSLGHFKEKQKPEKIKQDEVYQSKIKLD